MKKLKQIREEAIKKAKGPPYRVLKTKGYVPGAFIPNEDNKPTKKS